MDRLASAAGYLAAIIALAAGTYIAARAAGSPRTAIRRYLAAALVAVGVAAAVATPETLALTQGLDVLPNLVLFLGDLLAMGASFCVLAMLTHTFTCHDDAVRRYIRNEAIALAAAGAAMAVLLLAADTRTSPQFAATSMLNPYAVAYEVLYLLSMAWGMTGFLWLIRRHVRSDNNPRMRLVLRVNAAAGGVGLLWGAWKITTLIAPHVGLHLPVDRGTVSELLASVLVGLVGIGCTVPAWSTWLAARTDRARAHRAIEGITPLWQTLITAVPGVAFDSGNGTDVTYALYRKVIEIRDAQMALRAICQTDVADRARAAARRHGIPPGSDTALVVEAAQLAAALRTQQIGSSHPLHLTEPAVLAADTITHPPAGIATRALGESATTTAFRDTIDHDTARGTRNGTAPTVYAEAHWLIKLSRALNGSPVIAELLHDGREPC